MNFDWCADFVQAATTEPVPVEQQLAPLGHTRAELLAQLANATTMEQTALVRQYIGEANRRLRALP